jgi:hypothetical protein
MSDAFGKKFKNSMLICAVWLLSNYSPHAALLTEVRVNSDTTLVSELPNMDFNSTSERMVAVWDKFESPASVWFQVLDQDLAKIGENSLTCDDVYSSYEGDVAVAATGEFAITFAGRLLASDSTHVFVRFFYSDRTPKGPSIEVADNGVLVHQGEPAIAADSLGNVVVTWTDRRNTDHVDVWAQLFSSSGVKIGSNIRVSNDLDTCCVGYPKVSRNSSGQFVITWHANTRSGDPYLFGGNDIRFQQFQADGSKINSIITANSSSSDDIRRKEPAVSINRSGSFCIAWIATIENVLYVQFYNSSGDTIGTNIGIQRIEEPDETAISLEDNDIAALAWEEDSAGIGKGVFYQMFQSFALSGTPVMVIDSERYSPSVNMSSQDAFFLYEASNRRVMVAKLSDIATDFTDINTLELPNRFALLQNYPNPFNPETRIEFSLPRSGEVTIEIYNVLGQKVKTLVNERLSAGKKTVTWDGTDDSGALVSSGVYLYRIKAEDFVEAKKMLLLR